MALEYFPQNPDNGPLNLLPMLPRETGGARVRGGARVPGLSYRTFAKCSLGSADEPGNDGNGGLMSTRRRDEIPHL